MTITADSDSPVSKAAVDYIKETWEKALPGLTVEEKFVTLSSGELVKIANRSAEEMAGIVDVMSDLRVGENKISKIKALQLAQVSRSINEELNEIEEFKQLFQRIKKRENGHRL